VRSRRSRPGKPCRRGPAQSGRRELVAIQQRGGEDNPAGAKARNFQHAAHQTQRELVGQFLPLPPSDGPGTLFGFDPSDQALVFAQTLAAAEVTAHLAADAEDGLHLAAEALSQQAPGAKEPVTQQDITGLEDLPQILQEPQLAGAPRADRPLHDHAGGQTHQRHDAEDGKSTAWGLHGLLGETFLIGARIGSRHGGAIDDVHPAALPEVSLAQRAFGLPDDATVNLIQTFQRQGAAGLAVRTGRIRWNWLALGQAQGLGLANGLSAGSARLGDLPTKRPKDQAQGPLALARMRSFVGLGQRARWQPGTKEGLELVEGAGGRRAQGTARV